MALKQISNAQVAGLAGEKDEIVAHLRFPDDTTGVDPRRQLYTFLRGALRAGVGIPEIDDASFAPPIVFKEDFITGSYIVNTAGRSGKYDETADSGEWLVTLVDGDGDNAEVVGLSIDGGTNASAQGGWGTFTTTDKQAGELVGCQLNGESFKLASGKPLYFECRIAIEDISETEVFIGLSDSSTDLYAAGAGANNHVGFMIDGDGDIDFSIDEAGTQKKSDTGENIVDGSLATLETTDVTKRLAFYWDGVDTIQVYIDGVLITATDFDVTDNGSTIVIPDGTCLSPAFQVESQGSAAETLWIDYIMVAQAR